MTLRNILKKGKLAVTGVALGGALLATGCSKEAPKEVKDNSAKMEQRAEGKSEIRQKIAYLDEYVAAVEAGKNKEEAYQELSLKMADGNVKKMAEMQKQLNTLEKQMPSRPVGYMDVVLMMFAFGFIKDTLKTFTSQNEQRISRLGEDRD